MVGVTMRDNNKVEFGEINVEGLDVVLEDFGIVAGVEEDALAVMFDESREAPVSRDSFVIGKRVVENCHAILGKSMPGKHKRKKNCHQDEESANEFHQKPPRKKPVRDLVVFADEDGGAEDGGPQAGFVAAGRLGGVQGA